ncbi:hypothetical protein E2562_021391 [Oryza meyeriana var. granulata]|uniref:Uncharacterized protein n=1 Tax=Oryza meyeriana var. granulata TaxID=110450 RepID=A0A6G1EXJ5_9ORYZ|nr:hypothetical protein E2562_021391 [Oryza meyeriana var. granulata]
MPVRSDPAAQNLRDVMGKEKSERCIVVERTCGFGMIGGAMFAGTTASGNFCADLRQDLGAMPLVCWRN